MEKSSDKRITYIDLLRCLCAFAVVGIHITMTQPNNYSIEEIGESNYIVLTSVYAMVMWAVQVFLMISGNLLLHARQMTLAKIRKYVLRMFLVLMIFGTAYALMELVFEQRAFSIIMIPKALLMTLERKSWSHLWYLYVLIGIYIILLPLKRFVDNAKDQEIYALLLALIFGDFLIPEVNSVFALSLDSFMVFTQYVTYLLIGYVLPSFNFIRGGVCATAWFLASSIKIIAQYITVKNWGCGSPVLLDDRIFTLIQAVAVYGLFMRYMKDVKLNRLTESIGRCSFSIYLIHPFFINLLYKLLNITPTNFLNVYIAIPILWIAVFLISWLCSWIILKIPFMNRLL